MTKQAKIKEIEKILEERGMPLELANITEISKFFGFTEEFFYSAWVAREMNGCPIKQNELGFSGRTAELIYWMEEFYYRPYNKKATIKKIPSWREYIPAELLPEIWI